MKYIPINVARFLVGATIFLVALLLVSLMFMFPVLAYVLGGLLMVFGAWLVGTIILL